LSRAKSSFCLSQISARSLDSLYNKHFLLRFFKDENVGKFHDVCFVPRSKLGLYVGCQSKEVGGAEANEVMKGVAHRL
jgi:hypothetical protein